MTTSLLTDEELWLAITMDDSRAFAILYNRYWRKLYKTTVHYLKDETVAEEILHDVFVILWNRRRFLKIDNFKKYTHMTIRYHVYKHLKAVGNSPIDYVEQYEEHSMPLCLNNGEGKLNYHDVSVQLQSSLEPLPKRCREIFWLSRIENRSNEEIARQFGISKRTVENQITHALKHLRISYERLSEVVIFILIFSKL
ncbi:MAG: polymerase sigma-70 factor [Mucilaginibacter sp.]|jgi:RNA polymerase sigma-70 factor (family 1)|nr:polymerase sigma-70 factor [Mucilaginibacter sp.]